jgi:cytochrome c peroxidase
MAGLQLFNGKGNCNSCHVDGRSTTLMPGQTDTGNTPGGQAVFTCLGYANEGLPLNPRLPLFYESTPDGFGFTPNPDGLRYRDLGFGNFLRSGPQSAPNPNAFDWLQFAPSTDGQFQVATARDVAMTPPLVSHHRGRPGRRERETDTVFPEGALPQWLHQEPEATGALL